MILNPCPESHDTQLSPAAELTSRVRPSHFCQKGAPWGAALPAPAVTSSGFSDPEPSQPGASPPPCCLQEQPTGFPQHCQHTAGNNAHPALGGLTQEVKESSYWCRVKLLPWWLIMRHKHTLMGKSGWDVNKHKLYPFVLGKGVIDHQVLLPNNLPRVCDVLERKKTHTQRSEATALQGLIKKTIILLKVQLTISLTLLYHALSSLILLIHWLLSWGRTQRKSCQKKKENFYKNPKNMWNYVKGHHLKTEENTFMVFHTHITISTRNYMWGYLRHISIWTISKVNKGQKTRSQKIHHKMESISPPDLQ